MAKLNIDIGVNLGNTLQGLNSFLGSLELINGQLSAMTKNVSTLTGKKINIKAQVSSLTLPATNVKPINIPVQVNPTAINNATQSFSRLSGAANQANITLTNIGRVAQDLPYGFIGISNNLNPLVESFRDLKIQAAASGKSIGTELLNSLKGFGGIGIAVSAVSAAFSFLSVGLSYWSRGMSSAKKTSDDLITSTDLLNLSLVNIKKEFSGTGPLTEFELKLSSLKNAFVFGTSPIGNLRLKLVDFQNELLNTTPAIGSQAQQVEALKVQYDKAFKSLQDVNSESGKYTTFNNEYNNALQDVLTTYKDLEGIPESVIKKLEPTQQDALRAAVTAQKAYNEALTTEGSKRQQYQILEQEILNTKKAIAVQSAEDAASERKKRENQDSYLKLLKETKDDLLKIQGASNFNPLQKAEKSIDVINNFLNVGRDKFKEDFLKDAINPAAYQKKLDSLNIQKLLIEAQNLSKAIPLGIKDLKLEAKILNESTIDEQINSTKSKIKSLYGIFRDEGLKGILPKAIVFGQIRSAQEELKKLNLQKIGEEAKNIFEGLNNSISILKTKSVVFNISTTNDQLKETKAAFDKLSDIKIDFISKGNLEGAVAVQVLLESIKNTINTLSLQSLRENLTKTFGDFEKKFKGLERKELLFDVKLNKEKADAAVNALNELIKQGISPLDPRIIFLRLLGYKLNLQVKADDAAKKAADAINEALSKVFAQLGVTLGETLGVALAGGDVTDVLDSGIKALADNVKELGRTLIQMGTLAALAKANLFLSPGVTIAAGVGLVALGSYLQTKFKNGFAEGGFVSGKGHSTSDSIPAMLSNGEYVVKASSVRKFGKGYLDRLNQGQGFADGGMASIFTSGSRALVNRSDMPSFNPIKTNTADMMRGNNGYIAETKISGQDLKLILSRADRRYSNVT